MGRRVAVADSSIKKIRCRSGMEVIHKAVAPAYYLLKHSYKPMKDLRAAADIVRMILHHTARACAKTDEGEGPAKKKGHGMVAAGDQAHMDYNHPNMLRRCS